MLRKLLRKQLALRAGGLFFFFLRIRLTLFFMLMFFVLTTNPKNRPKPILSVSVLCEYFLKKIFNVYLTIIFILHLCKAALQL